MAREPLGFRPNRAVLPHVMTSYAISDGPQQFLCFGAKHFLRSILGWMAGRVYEVLNSRGSNANVLSPMARRGSIGITRR